MALNAYSNELHLNFMIHNKICYLVLLKYSNIKCDEVKIWKFEVNCVIFSLFGKVLMFYKKYYSFSIEDRVVKTMIIM